VYSLDDERECLAGNASGCTYPGIFTHVSGPTTNVERGSSYLGSAARAVISQRHYDRRDSSYSDLEKLRQKDEIEFFAENVVFFM
jgi:hypothetical protein